MSFVLRGGGGGVRVPCPNPWFHHWPPPPPPHGSATGQCTTSSLKTREVNNTINLCWAQALLTLCYQGTSEGKTSPVHIAIRCNELKSRIWSVNVSGAITRNFIRIGASMSICEMIYNNIIGKLTYLVVICQNIMHLLLPRCTCFQKWW